jgi:hypothetical protein
MDPKRIDFQAFAPEAACNAAHQLPLLIVEKNGQNTAIPSIGGCSVVRTQLPF